MTPINEEEADQLILVYLQGKATDAQKRKLLEWMEGDSANARYFSEMKAMWKSGQKPDFQEMQVLSGTRSKNIRKIIYSVAIAASVAVAALLGFSFFQDSPSLETFSTEDGSVRNFVLADGTNVKLMPYSTLSIDEKKFSGIRDVRLAGEAQFDVAHDAQKPFTVYLQDFSVRVKGTVFKVRDSSVSGTAETILAEGAVDLLDEDGKRLLSMVPGQKASLDKNGEFIVSHVSDEELIMMRYGIRIIKQQSLDSIIDKLEKDYGVQIRSEEVHPKDSLYTIGYPKDSGIRAVLDILETISGYRFTIAEQQ